MAVFPCLAICKSLIDCYLLKSIDILLYIHYFNKNINFLPMKVTQLWNVPLKKCYFFKDNRTQSCANKVCNCAHKNCWQAVKKPRKYIIATVSSNCQVYIRKWRSVPVTSDRFCKHSVCDRYAFFVTKLLHSILSLVATCFLYLQLNISHFLKVPPIILSVALDCIVKDATSSSYTCTT